LEEEIDSVGKRGEFEIRDDPLEAKQMWFNV